MNAQAYIQSSAHARTFVHTHMCTHAQAYICLSAHACTCVTYMCTHAQAYICSLECTHMHMCNTHMCTHIHTGIHMLGFTRTHMCTHAHMCPLLPGRGTPSLLHRQCLLFLSPGEFRGIFPDSLPVRCSSSAPATSGRVPKQTLLVALYIRPRASPLALLLVAPNPSAHFTASQNHNTIVIPSPQQL